MTNAEVKANALMHTANQMQAREWYDPEVFYARIVAVIAGVREVAASLASAREENERLRAAVRDVRSEVNCRIEHGATGRTEEHLKYVQDRLDAALGERDGGTDEKAQA